MQLDTRQLHIAVPPEHNGGPIPLLIKYAPDGKPNCWALADGSAVYLDREWAEKAAYMKTDDYRDGIRRRASAGHLVRAVVVDDYEGWVTTDGDDYAQDVPLCLKSTATTWRGQELRPMISRRNCPRGLIAAQKMASSSTWKTIWIAIFPTIIMKMPVIGW